MWVPVHEATSEETNVLGVAVGCKRGCILPRNPKKRLALPIGHSSQLKVGLGSVTLIATYGEDGLWNLLTVVFENEFCFSLFVGVPGVRKRSPRRVYYFALGGV